MSTEAPWRCIKPHCALNCDGCNSAIRNEPGPRMLVLELLECFAFDYEDGDSKLVDKARAYLQIPEAQLESEAIRPYVEALRDIEHKANLAAEMCDSEGRADGFRLIASTASAALSSSPAYRQTEGATPSASGASGL